MKTRKISGQKYQILPNGVLIPEMLVREVPKKITKSQEAYSLLLDIAHAAQENVAVLTLDGNNHIIRRSIITVGLVNQCQIHPREVFRSAILDNAVSLILAHNHPSGAMDPSESDLTATRRISDAGRVIGITLLDHIIVSVNGFTSLRENYGAYF